MKLNNNGMTLIEVMVACTILAIVSYWFNTMLVSQIKIAKKITTMNAAVKTNFRTYIPTACTLLQGASNTTIQWYAKQSASNTVGFYKNSSNCSQNYIGTLTTGANATYDDNTTNTFWNVSGDTSTLRVLVIKLQL